MLTWWTMPVPGRDDLEVVEGTLAPAQELVALLVALVLDLDVALERLRRAEDVGDHGVVDDHLGGRERVDPGGVAAEVGHGLAHGGQVDDTGDAGEVLHDHARRRELDLLAGIGIRVPAGEREDVVLGDVRAVLGAQQVLEQHLQAVRQRGDRVVGQIIPGDRAQPVDLVGLTVHFQRALGTKAVDVRHPPSPRESGVLLGPHPAAVDVPTEQGDQQCLLTSRYTTRERAARNRAGRARRTRRGGSSGTGRTRAATGSS